MQQTSTKEVQTRLDWEGKVFHWEMFKRLKFDLTPKRYMHKLESSLENKTNKIQWDFEKQTGSPNPGQMTRPSVN